jgi:hypothetical protein
MAKSSTETVTETDKKGPKDEKKRRGRPPKGSQVEGSHSIFESISRVAKEDWGTRVQLYLYRTAPLIDRSRSGQPNYICTYYESVNEDRIMTDFGSGGYKLLLAFRKPGAEKGDELDSGYIKILNLKFPPKVPEGEWVDDPRNKEWSWAKQYFTQGKADGKAQVLETLQVLNDIRSSVTEELKPVQPPSDPVKNTVETIRGVKELFQVQQPEAPEKQLASLAAILKELRPVEKEDKLSNFLLAQHTDLMKEFIKVRENGAGNNGSLAVVKELITGIKDLMPSVKEVFPAIGEAATGRSRLGSWQEFSVAMAPHISPILSPFAVAFSQLIMMKMQTAGQPQNPGMVAHQQALPGPTGTPTMMPFLQMIAMPMVNKIRFAAPPDNIDPAELGKEFGAWVSEGFSSHPNYQQAMLAVQAMGPTGLIAALRPTPVWMDKGPQGIFPNLAEMEAKLPAFFDAFLKWTPEDADEEDDGEVPKVLTYSEGAEG